MESSISISNKFRYIKITYIYKKCVLDLLVTWFGICGNKIYINVTTNHAKSLSN